MTMYSQYIFSLLLFTVKINTYSVQTGKYINTKLGTVQIYIYHLLKKTNSVRDLIYQVLKPLTTYHDI